MKPARMPSRWVKLVPWYYAERSQPSRMADKAKAVKTEIHADSELNEVSE